jgi:hypothetical protein
MIRDRPIAQWIQIAAGALLLGAGIWLGFIVFRQSQEILHQPAKLAVWLELNKAIADSASPEKKQDSPLFSFKPEASLIKDEQIRTLGAYFTLFLGILLLFVMAKIAAAFVSAGARLMRTGLDARPPLEEDH